jgi:actin-related protein 6
MRNERFTIPEVIFSPSDIGINQAGLAEAVIQTIDKCPKVFAD